MCCGRKAPRLRLHDDRGAAALNDYARTNDPLQARNTRSTSRSPGHPRLVGKLRVAGRAPLRDRGQLAATARLDRDTFRRVENPRGRSPPPRYPIGVYVHSINGRRSRYGEICTEVDSPKCNGTPGSLPYFCSRAFGLARTSNRRRSYEDDVPPSPDLRVPADDHARHLHVPHRTRPRRQG